MTTDLNWQDRALCAQTAPDSFFPEKGENDRIKEARGICNGNPKRGIEPCPVRAECLADALANDDRYGVRAGMTPRERRRLRKGGAA